MVQKFLTWLYRPLGRRYPYAFVALELQTVWFIGAATLGLFALYYEPDTTDFWKIIALTFALTAVVLTVAITRIFKFMRPLSRWIGGERDEESTTQAWATAVGLPLYHIKRDMWLPIFGVAAPVSIASILIYELSWLAFFPLFLGGLIALAYSGILHYYALEAGMRPVLVDINSEVGPRFSTDVESLSLRYKLILGMPMICIITGVVASAFSSAGEGGGGAALGLDVAIAIAVAGTLSFELTWMLSKSILHPLEDLQAGIHAVEEGDYDVVIPVTTADELGEASAAFNKMARGLAEREKIREAFGTYLDKEVAEYILSEGFETAGNEVEVSLLFCDVRGFTSFAGDAEATEVVACLNALFEVVVPIVAKHGGHVDKFVGDGLLAVFGAPEPHPDHADRAVRCAIEMAEQVNHGDSELLPIGIGVNSGEVVAGSIGGAGRLNFSVIGDAVNVAARVEAATRDLDEEVLITEETRRLLSEEVDVTSRGAHQLKGKDEPVDLWAPLVQTREHPVPS